MESSLAPFTGGSHLESSPRAPPAAEKLPLFEAVPRRNLQRQQRAIAVIAAREGRAKDSLGAALQAFEDGTHQKEPEPDIASQIASLVELLLIVRNACSIGDITCGLMFLSKLEHLVERLTGADGQAPLLHPCPAATLLMCTAELCLLYGHEEKAEEYAATYLGLARVAHGEGSAAVGDAHSFLCALLVARARHEEALEHARALLQIRQKGSDRRPVADAHWNLGVLLHELKRDGEAVESLKAGRQLYAEESGEGVLTAMVDVALAAVFRSQGEYLKEVQALRLAVRGRQRAVGFGHSETREATALLAAAEINYHELVSQGVSEDWSERGHHWEEDSAHSAASSRRPSVTDAGPVARRLSRGGGAASRVKVSGPTASTAPLPGTPSRRPSRGGGAMHSR